MPQLVGIVLGLHYVYPSTQVRLIPITLYVHQEIPRSGMENLQYLITAILIPVYIHMTHSVNKV